MQATVEKGRPWVSLRDSLNGFVSDARQGSKYYELVKSGQLKSIKIGRNELLPPAEAMKFLPALAAPPTMADPISMIATGASLASTALGAASSIMGGNAKGAAADAQAQGQEFMAQQEMNNAEIGRRKAAQTRS
jgi:hypothetical protein